jgi:hypothetical protein
MILHDLYFNSRQASAQNSIVVKWNPSYLSA